MPLFAILMLIIYSFRIVANAATLDDLWKGNAHFSQIGEIDWKKLPEGDASEESSWFVARNGIWYAFSRATLPNWVNYCPASHTHIVVRESRDQGKTWSPRATAIEAGDSLKGDGCAVLDGSSFYDEATDSWHILAQCLARENAGGWALCHYTRKGPSPLGRFTSDPENPVVPGGSLWSRICRSTGKACPKSTRDEGTPEIIAKRNGRFLVTIHGFDYGSNTGYRGVATTVDFRKWQVSGGGLPNAATLGPIDCRAWLAGCAGTGLASTVSERSYIYMLVETMDKSLICLPDQDWVFQLIRAPRDHWPGSGKLLWSKLPGPPLLSRTWPDRNTLCALEYARLFIDRKEIFLIYEDWEPGHRTVHRRILKLVTGGGERIQTQNIAQPVGRATAVPPQ